MNLLSLDQCRKLKEWGYPQADAYFHWYLYEPDGQWETQSPEPVWMEVNRGNWEYDAAVENEEECYADPTLDELIVWLGDDILSLDRAVSTAGNTYWWTRPRLKDTKRITGKTLLEAVFKLAEALNQPKEGR
jgi:hypothetical protein